MKINKTFVAILAMAALPSMADVEALYWQVTNDNNPDQIEFAAAAMVAENGGTKVYLTDVNNHNVWQAANSDKTTTEAIASTWDNDYSSDGWSFYIELMNQDSGNNWYTAGTINNGDSNWSYDDIKSHIYSSSSMSMSLATPITTGTAHIPEPTSGLLMLVGGALLALRRRRV